MGMDVSTQRVALIFEAVNEDLHESYVGMTCTPLKVLERRHRELKPTTIAHWKPEHHVEYKLVECGLSVAVGPAFVKSYVQTSARFGWTVLVDSLH